MFLNNTNTIALTEKINKLLPEENKMDHTLKDIAILVDNLLDTKQELLVGLKNVVSFIPESISQVNESEGYNSGELFTDLLIYLKSEHNISQKETKLLIGGLNNKGIKIHQYEN